MATDSSRKVYVADTDNNRIEKFTEKGTFLRKWGSYGTGDGAFKYPAAVAIGSAGHVYVVESINNRVQEFSSTGGFIRKWGGFGSGNKQFIAPDGIATDSAGNVYVGDNGNNRIQKFDSTGTFLRMWGWGVKDGSSAFQTCTSSCQAGISGSGNGQFNHPTGVATDFFSGNVYVADQANNRIQKFDSNGNFIRKWGGTSGTGNYQFSGPRGVATDLNGDVYVADQGNNRIMKFTSAGGFIKKWGTSGSGPGQFSSPARVATDSSGIVYVADKGNNRIQKLWQGDEAVLVARYTPTLLYNAEELYHADSVREITDNYKITNGGFTDCISGDNDDYTNYLTDSGGTALAASDPNRSCADLNINFLKPTYPTGQTATNDDVLHEHPGSEADDATRMHLTTDASGNLIYANRVYGRAVYSADSIWLQYWFFYYYNSLEFVHEGDWEMIEVGLYNSGTPYKTAYAQHNDDQGHTCDWINVGKDGTSPKVYVAKDSHASYYTPDYTLRYGTVVDYHYGDGDYASPTSGIAVYHLNLVDVSNLGPSWLRWPGVWGGSGGGIGGSPRGPKFQTSKWNNPAGFASSNPPAGDCDP